MCMCVRVLQMAIKELSELQSELETLKEKNKQAEVSLLTEQGLTREKVKQVGILHMAINNLAQQCYLPTYGPLENMNTLTMMDMVKVMHQGNSLINVVLLYNLGSIISNQEFDFRSTSWTRPTQRRERGG